MTQDGNNPISHETEDTGAPRIGQIDGHVKSREHLATLICEALDTSKKPHYSAIAVDFRTISKLFPDSEFHPAEFGLKHINYHELRQWAATIGLKVDYLKGTEEKSLRPILFEYIRH